MAARGQSFKGQARGALEVVCSNITKNQSKELDSGKHASDSPLLRELPYISGKVDEPFAEDG